MELVLLFGLPGSGKTHFSVHKTLNRVLLGQLLRDDSDPIIMECMRRGDTVPIEISMRILNKVLENRTGKVVLDGFPRNLEQLEALDGDGYSVAKVIFFNISKEICRLRLKKRNRFDDTEEIIRRRFHQFEIETLPLVEILRERGVPIVEITDIEEIV